MAHTEGPWEIGDDVDSQGDLVYIPIRRGKLHISTTGVYGRKPDGSTAGRKYIDRFGTERHQPVITAEECRANARLIAAAPDLLAACEAAKLALRATSKAEKDYTFELCLLNAAIAKAKG